MSKGLCPQERELYVHLLPGLVPEGRLRGGVAVVIDVLRATTTIVHALSAGCACVRPCAEIDDARKLADGMRAGRVILAGERGGEKIPGFDRGNSPREFCRTSSEGMTLVLTTTNGTRALLRATEADRVLIGAFANFSAICEQLKPDKRPLHIICAGTDGEPSVEDTVLAGAFVDFLCERCEVRLNDAARMAWDCFENNGQLLRSTLDLGRGGQTLKKLGYDDDITIAAEIDSLMLVPELKRDPLRVEIASVGVVASHWPK